MQTVFDHVESCRRDQGNEEVLFAAPPPSPREMGKKKVHIQHQRMYFITIYMGKTGREHSDVKAIK